MVISFQQNMVQKHLEFLRGTNMVQKYNNKKRAKDKI
jgi:hypothetical protein